MLGLRISEDAPMGFSFLSGQLRELVLRMEPLTDLYPVSSQFFVPFPCVEYIVTGEGVIVRFQVRIFNMFGRFCIEFGVARLHHAFLNTLNLRQASG